MQCLGLVLISTGCADQATVSTVLFDQYWRLKSQLWLSVAWQKVTVTVVLGRHAGHDCEGVHSLYSLRIVCLYQFPATWTGAAVGVI